VAIGARSRTTRRPGRGRGRRQALADPLILSQVLQLRAGYETGRSGLDRAEVFATEALDLATAAQDGWEIAMASYARAMAAPDITELRARVDCAAGLLDDVGNAYQLASLLAAAAYGALQMGGDRDAKEYVARAIPTTRRLDNPFLWMLLQGNLACQHKPAAKPCKPRTPTPRLQLAPRRGGNGEHRRAPGVDRFDDLGVVDALQVDRGDPKVAVPELALDDD
jgi:hypothetical protein